MTGLLVTADPTTCVTSCMCVYRAPEVFDQDDDGLVVVLDARPPAELHDAVRRAARGCPTQSITLTDQPL
ncbi:ferredoxin [Actinoplanes siamensis]|uniref:Ferredoxin n=1 Tax=Actinoplanes siamensis TaxID=1223317 RepID=A0A919N9N2_9ACTN|nr:ferredoxin [Actinoplanes siamensis]GIF07092.1 ferredoxin [Actinoplanes siamensis]